MYTPNNLNLYHYSNNNPLKFKDPDGRFWGLAVKAAGAFFRTPLGRRAAIYLAAQAAKYLQEPLQKAGEYAEEKNREAGDSLSEKINDLNNAMAKDETTPQEELDKGGAEQPELQEDPDNRKKAPTPRKKSSQQLRQEWEELNGEEWPRDESGRNYDADHNDPLADGGEDSGNNITPRTRRDHIQRHKENGDFKRWGLRRGTNED